MFSAALCRGLIEVRRGCAPMRSAAAGFPRLYAAASLKLGVWAIASVSDVEFSAALCRGLIEADLLVLPLSRTATFSAALCRGLIEASASSAPFSGWAMFSAALCRGLIEAAKDEDVLEHAAMRFPRLYAAASLKLAALDAGRLVVTNVFRGFMPRPH